MVALDSCVTSWNLAFHFQKISFVHPEIAASAQSQTDIWHASTSSVLEMLRFCMTSFIPSCILPNSQSGIFQTPTSTLWCNVPANNAKKHSSPRKSQQFDKWYLHAHTHTVGKASLRKVTSTMKHAELHCWASLPVRHWCGNSHLRVIMGWLAPRVWDPGADSLGSRKKARERERGGEKICTLNRRMSHSLHPSNSLCSVSFSVSISRSPLRTYLLHYLGV